MVEVERNLAEGEIESLFDGWISRIAKEVPLDELVAHLREHTGRHFERFDRSEPINMTVWLVDVLNFMHILEKKELGITREEMLFKLALHYRKSRTGPAPEFDIDKFINSYQGRLKRFDALSLNDRQKDNDGSE